MKDEELDWIWIGFVFPVIRLILSVTCYPPRPLSTCIPTYLGSLQV